MKVVIGGAYTGPAEVKYCNDPAYSVLIAGCVG